MLPDLSTTAFSFCASGVCYGLPLYMRRKKRPSDENPAFPATPLTIASIYVSAFSSLVLVKESEGVLSEVNLSAYKMGQTGAVPRIEGCSQTLVIPPGRVQEVKSLISLIFCPSLLLMLPVDRSQLKAKRQGTSSMQSI